jgi:hypothetical protein
MPAPIIEPKANTARQHATDDVHVRPKHFAFRAAPVALRPVEAILALDLDHLLGLADA